jgi:hypothetical protein
MCVQNQCVPVAADAGPQPDAMEAMDAIATDMDSTTPAMDADNESDTGSPDAIAGSQDAASAMDAIASNADASTARDGASNGSDGGKTTGGNGKGCGCDTTSSRGSTAYAMFALLPLLVLRISGSRSRFRRALLG